MRKWMLWGLVLVVFGGMGLDAGTIKVLRPRAGESFNQGFSIPVEWRAEGIGGTVTIALRDMDRKVQYTVQAGIPAGSGTFTISLAGQNKYQTGRYIVKVVQGNVRGKSAEFRIAPKADAVMIPRRPGDPVHTLANKPGGVVAANNSLQGMLEPVVKDFETYKSPAVFPGNVDFYYKVVNADKVMLYDQSEMQNPLWTSTRNTGSISVPIFLGSDAAMNVMYKTGTSHKFYSLIAVLGNRKHEMAVKVAVAPKYPEAVVRDARVQPVTGPWGSDAALIYDFANVLQVELTPFGTDPADPYGKQSYILSPAGGSGISGKQAVKIHAGKGWSIRMKRRDGVSFFTYSIIGGDAGIPVVKDFSASRTALSAPGLVDFSVHFLGARTVDLVEQISGRVVHTFDGKKGGEVKDSHPVYVSKTGVYQLKARCFSRETKSKTIQVEVKGRPLGGFDVTVKRDGGIFPSPNVTLTYKVYGQDFIKFYYQAKGDTEPTTLIKEFTGLNGVATKGSFKHRPEGFPARYKVIIRDQVNNLQQIRYYTAQ